MKKDDPKSQHARFIETARALGCDDDEATFRAKLAVIARQKRKGGPHDYAGDAALARELRKRLIEDCDKSSDLGYNPKKLRGMIAADGPIEACIQVISSQKIPDGFIRLLEMQKLEFTAEATILDGPWITLFDEGVRSAARKRLRSYNRPDLAK